MTPRRVITTCRADMAGIPSVLTYGHACCKIEFQSSSEADYVGAGTCWLPRPWVVMMQPYMGQLHGLFQIIPYLPQHCHAPEVQYLK
jgi:hypothetical protein